MPLLRCVTGIAFKQVMFSVLAVSWFLNCHLKCKPMWILEGNLLRLPEPEHGGLEAGGQGSSAHWGFPWLGATALWESGSGGRAWGGAVWCLLANCWQEICRSCLVSSNRSRHRIVLRACFRVLCWAIWMLFYWGLRLWVRNVEKQLKHWAPKERKSGFELLP